jgi:hypothetical protein
MFHSFGPASGGTGQIRLPFPFSLLLIICAVVEQQEGAGCTYTTRQFAWFPERRPVERPIPDIFRLEFVTWCVACGVFSSKPLLAQTEPFHNLAVPIRVSPVEIVQESPALVDHHDQSPP